MGISFSQDQLDKIHRIQFEMLVELDQICRKHSINYIISGGTLLGAVRDKHFIKWDDDIDIRMDRSEYDKFCRVVNSELDNSKYFFQTHETDKYYPWYYGKIRYIRSNYARVGQEHLKMRDGIFIDVMPADGLPNSRVLRRWLIIRCFVLKKFLYSVVGCQIERNIGKRIVYSLMNIVPKSIIYKSLDRKARKYSSQKYKKVTSYSFVKPSQKRFTNRIWHYDCIEMEFEGRKFFAPKEYDKWLKMTYGADYITPPPPKDQIGHNDIAVFDIKED